MKTASEIKIMVKTDSEGCIIATARDMDGNKCTYDGDQHEYDGEDVEDIENSLRDAAYSAFKSRS